MTLGGKLSACWVVCGKRAPRTHIIIPRGVKLKREDSKTAVLWASNSAGRVFMYVFQSMKILKNTLPNQAAARARPDSVGWLNATSPRRISAPSIAIP